MSIELTPQQQLTYMLLTCANFSGFGGRRPDQVKISPIQPGALDDFDRIVRDLSIEYTPDPQDQSSYIISKDSWDREIAQPSEGVLKKVQSFNSRDRFTAEKFQELCKLLEQVKDQIEWSKHQDPKKKTLHFCSAGLKKFFETMGFLCHPAGASKKGNHITLPFGLHAILNHHFGRELGRAGCLDIEEVHYHAEAPSAASSSAQPLARNGGDIGSPTNFHKSTSDDMSDEQPLLPPDAKPSGAGTFSGSAAVGNRAPAQKEPCCCILF